jgi:ATP-binding protein involved in chromosome partitioning
MKIIGLVENMSDFCCPHCSKKITLFGDGGGAKIAKYMDVPMLGEIPIEPEMVDKGDIGTLAALIDRNDLELNSAYRHVLAEIEKV